jgi:uncharacterized protein (DUF2141 family)
MKHLLTAFAIFLSMVSYSQINTLTVTITNFKNNQGKVMVAIYTGKDNFMKKAIFRKSTTINTNATKVVFENIPDGEYAISLFHDENDNNTLDTGWFGIPKEGYGCSNDAKGMMGPPKYEDAKFQLTNDGALSIKINQ